MDNSILIIDDDAGLRNSLSVFLQKNSFNVYQAAGAKKGINIIKDKDIDLVLLDIRMPKINGIEALKMIKQINSSLNIIIITGYGSIETAVEAMKEGAFDYITKPFNLKELINKINKALEINYLVVRNKLESKENNIKKNFDNIIGKSESMQKIYNLIKKIAKNNVTVLILGESGVGKEMIAKAIHNHSSRSDGPFIKVNCAALPESLLESELFGYEKGAFTGANKKKKGMFELANKGTLFLDEIGDMTLATQAKILRVLQEREFRSVGGEKFIKVDVRVLAATNTDLKKAIIENNFREDLYYRLNVIKIKVPPLRERREDIPLLSTYFLKKYSKKHNKIIDVLTPDATHILMCHDWPGNVRELENVIEQAIVLSENNVVTSLDFPSEIRGRGFDVDGIESKGLKDITKNLTSEIEKKIILDTLVETNWNRNQTAEMLEITPRTLYNKIKEYKIDMNR
ncbi:sigma-54 dependent transcriptional regulator [Halocella sp. SP3-1]|uniref:sigma-54-dependent transcriptional regulator n=1 Tax=Halocella sp. SP3-1 TaxID=2382161 RepID=UPI000F758651|nr:sigma-54 dependent transcriptional regulator [Halocella sp. SP3-1]AZO95305.1 sigma-54-dependent Fis family transcriptional regulator [Halocella sp. SP3-1]